MDQYWSFRHSTIISETYIILYFIIFYCFISYHFVSYHLFYYIILYYIMLCYIILLYLYMCTFLVYKVLFLLEQFPSLFGFWAWGSNGTCDSHQLSNSPGFLTHRRGVSFGAFADMTKRRSASIPQFLTKATGCGSKSIAYLLEKIATY